MEKILSIIIPTYNMENYLRKCLDSLIVSDENMEHLEVLVINDGSKDSSSSIGHEYEAKCPQTFRVIDKENGNYGSCINRGLKEATGKYVKVLDADDYFDKSILDKYVCYLTTVEVDLIITDYNIVNDRGDALSIFTFDLPIDKIFSLSDINPGLSIYMWHHGITYNKSLFDKIVYCQTEGISYTDDEWVFKPMFVVRSILYYPQTLYLYLRGREGQTFDSKVVRRTLEQRVLVAKEMMDFYKKNISLCLSDNVQFLTQKLSQRIKAVYNYHLFLFPSTNSYKRIKKFDMHIREQHINIYNELNKVKNRVGWHYIYQWREMNYSKYTPSIMVMRIKNRVLSLINYETIKIEKIPPKYSRNK